MAICTIIERPSSEPHVLLVSQYRPPVEQWVIEMPAGLVDAGEEGKEGATRAALRELQEETGYGGSQEDAAAGKDGKNGDDDGRGELTVLETSEIMVSDPGLSGANMRLCVVRIDVADDAPEPVAQPEEGEFIEKHLVPVKGLYAGLKGEQGGSGGICICSIALGALSPIFSAHATPIFGRNAPQSSSGKATRSTRASRTLPTACSSPTRRRRAARTPSSRPSGAKSTRHIPLRSMRSRGAPPPPFLPRVYAYAK